MKSIILNKRFLFDSFRMPFDWRTPTGYLITFSIQYYAYHFLLVNCCCVLSFIVGICFILIPTIEITVKEFHVPNYVHNESENMDDDELKTRLYDLIRFHSNFKELSWVVLNLAVLVYTLPVKILATFVWKTRSASKLLTGSVFHEGKLIINLSHFRLVVEFLDIYEVVITVYYLWSISTVCSTLLVIHLETDNINLMNLMSELIFIVYAFGQMFFFSVKWAKIWLINSVVCRMHSTLRAGICFRYICKESFQLCWSQRNDQSIFRDLPIWNARATHLKK